MKLQLLTFDFKLCMPFIDKIMYQGYVRQHAIQKLRVSAKTAYIQITSCTVNLCTALSLFISIFVQTFLWISFFKKIMYVYIRFAAKIL